MVLSSNEMERIVRSEAPRLATAIQQAAEEAHNEAEFRRPVANAIEDFGGVWIAEHTKGGERRERGFASFAAFRGFRDPTPLRCKGAR